MTDGTLKSQVRPSGTNGLNELIKFHRNRLRCTRVVQIWLARAAEGNSYETVLVKTSNCFFILYFII